MAAVATYLDFIADSPTLDTEKTYTVVRDMIHTEKGKRLSNITWSSIGVSINDVRGRTSEFSLETSGFQIVKHNSQVPPICNLSTMNDYL